MQFAETVGLDLSKAWPTDLKTRAPQFDDFDLVVCLSAATFTHPPRLPFHTTALTWEVDASQGPEHAYRELTPQIRELMERLRGEQAG